MDNDDRIATYSGDCYAPAEVLDTSQQPGQQSGTALFGSIGAEVAIQLDYIGETNPIQMGLATAIASDTDWFDTGKKKDYVDVLVRRHKHLDAQKLKDETYQWPDILTLNGVSFAYSFQALVRGRNEFYEIKPDSPSGLRHGQEKLDNIRKMHRRHQLHTIYKPGNYYPRNNPKKIELRKNRQFVHAAVTFLRQNALTRVRLYLTLRRPEDALLLYKLCIEIESEDKRKQQALAKAAAKHLFAAYVVCHAPERFQSVARELGDYSFQGDRFPRVRCSFSTLDTLAPYRKSLEQAINMRALGLPGEEYLLCCDENFYRAVLAPRTPDAIGELWARFLGASKLLATYAAGSAGWQKLQPMILGAEEAAKQIKLLYPDLVEFANRVLAWVMAHPYEAIAIVMSTMVLTASVVGLLETGLMGAGAALVAGESITETTALPVISGAGRLATAEAVASQMFSAEVASGAAVRGLMTAEEVAAQIGGSGAIANDTAFVASALQQTAVRAALTQTATIAAAAGFVLMVNCNTAYAQSSTSQAPSPKNPVVAQGVSRLLMIRARAVQRSGLKPAENGMLINLNDYADLPPAFSNPFELPPPVYTRLVGKVMLS